MSKRLQVILEDPEYREVQQAARARHVSVAHWVREALTAARHREPLDDAVKKLESIRAAARYDFPSGDIGHILSEIEVGYDSGARS